MLRIMAITLVSPKGTILHSKKFQSLFILNLYSIRFGFLFSKTAAMLFFTSGSIFCGNSSSIGLLRNSSAGIIRFFLSPDLKSMIVLLLSSTNIKSGMAERMELVYCSLSFMACSMFFRWVMSVWVPMQRIGCMSLSQLIVFPLSSIHLYDPSLHNKRYSNS